MLIGKGITTMAQLLALDRQGMHRLWNSVWGDRMYHWLHGHATGDNGAPMPNEMQQSLGHSHVLGPAHRSPEGAWAVAHKLLHKAAMRLRMEKFCANTMSLTIRYQFSREQVNALVAEGDGRAETVPRETRLRLAAKRPTRTQKEVAAAYQRYPA